MANATVTVESSGGDYTTLNSALSTEAADLTTNCHSTGGPGILTIQCGNFQDTTAASTGTSYTTSSSYYINIVGDPAERTSSNTGKWSTERYRLSYGSGNILTLAERYISIDGLQFQATGSSALWAIADGGAGSSACTWTIQNCVFVKTGTQNEVAAIGADTTTGTVTLNIRNCIVYGFAASGLYGDAIVSIVMSNVTANIDNLTGYNCYYGIHIYSGSPTITCRNVGLAAMGGTAFSAGITQTTCSTSTPTFVSTTGGSEDLHLQSSDTTWRNQGTDLSSTFTTDIDGTTRPTGAGTWDIGADEYVAAAGARPLPHRLFGGPFVGPFRGAFAC